MIYYLYVTDDSMQYRASTFQCRDGFKYQWILALTKNLDTMKEVDYQNNCIDINFMSCCT